MTRNLMMAGAAVVAATATALGSLAGNASTGSRVAWLPTMNEYALWWLAGSILAVAASALLVVWVQRHYESALRELVPAVQQPEPWVVDRPVELARIVQALRRRPAAATGGATTVIQGAGGFGKTTLARLVGTDRRVLRRFAGRVYWVTVGRDARRGALLTKVNDLVRQIDPQRAHAFTGVEQAADHLAAVLAAGPRRLVIVDDVWFDSQLAAFPTPGPAVRIVTTRNPSLLSGQAATVRVDQLTGAQARSILTAGLARLPAAVVAALAAEAGRSPQILRMINRILVDQCRLHADAIAVGDDLLRRLRRGGPLELDALAGAVERDIDAGDPERRLTLAATIEASTGLLKGDERQRFVELGIFVEDEDVPVALVARLWRARGGLDEMTARASCARLADLALVNVAATDDGGVVRLHDTIRDYVRCELGEARVREVTADWLRTFAADLPAALPLVADDDRTEVTAWWQFPGGAHYLWDHLLEHLVAAGRAIEADRTVADLRWIAARLERTGPAGPAADLTRVDTARARRLGRVLRQNAHLFTRTVPGHSRVDILHSRVALDPDWGPQARVLAGGHGRPALTNRRPPPDLPHHKLVRVLRGHVGPVTAVAVAPDGSWLASGGLDGTVRIWAESTGRELAVLRGHRIGVGGVAIGSTGTWLASAGYDGTVRIWEVDTGRERAVLGGHRGVVRAVVFGPADVWLASSGDDGAIRIWDVVTGRLYAMWDSGGGSVQAMAIAPDGTWLATAGLDEQVRIWDVRTGQQRKTLGGNRYGVAVLTISPRGSWLATGGRGAGWVRIWQVDSGRQHAILVSRRAPVHGLAVTPDDGWLVSGGGDGLVRLLEATTGRERHRFPGHTGAVSAVAVAPGGTWLASASYDRSVRIWEIAGDAPESGDSADHLTTAAADGDPADCPAAPGTQGDPADHRAALAVGGGPVNALAVAPDGSWLATGCGDRSVHIWEFATGRKRVELAGGRYGVRAVAIAPDGTWLATGGGDHAVRIWDLATARQRAELAGHRSEVNAVAIAPDGTWLASAGVDRSIRIWDLGTGQPRAELAGHLQPVRALAIDPNGSWLASAGVDRSIQIWDLGTRRPMELTGHAADVRAIAVAPNGSWLASGGDDCSVRLWDAGTGRLRAELVGHSHPVSSVAIARDGSWLASTDRDGSILIWPAAGGEAVAEMRVDAPLNACAWGPSGHGLVAGGDAGIYQFDFLVPGS